MKYQILIKRQARNKLKELPILQRNRLVEKIFQLSRAENHADLDIKKLVGQPFLRLRVGSWRVIFDKDDQIRIISIEKIKSRGDVYK